jgi:glutamate dehydrogenase
MARVDGLPSVILDNVAKLIHQKVPSETAPLVEQFSQILYGNMSNVDLADRNDSDMYGALLSLWNALNSHKSDSPYIRVFNPQVSKNGWTSTHTVIEVIIKDMPFLVDSLRIALNRLGLSAHLMLNCPIKLVRDENNQVTKIAASAKRIKSTSVETVFFIEIDRQTDAQAIEDLTAELLSVVSDVILTVADWEPMRKKLITLTKELEQANVPADETHKTETVEFLNWLASDHFTLMGYRSYSVEEVKGDTALVADVKSSLGLMKNSNGTKQRLVSRLNESGRNIAFGNNLLILTKTNSKSRVHRPAHLDYIGIKRFDDKGQVIGEERFVGLFGSAFYNSSALDLPIIRHKVARVCENSEFAPGSHSYKSLINILETYPRDEI